MTIAYDWTRAIRDAEIAAVENARRGTIPKPEHVMWEMLREAARVSRIAYSAPPRTGYPVKSTMPDGPEEFSMWQRMSAYLRGEIGEVDVDCARPPQPSADQISRADAVLHLWHNHALIRKGARSRIKRAVYLKACDVPDRKVRAVTGLSREAIHRAKHEAMRDMLDAMQDMG